MSRHFTWRDAFYLGISIISLPGMIAASAIKRAQ